MGCSANQFNHRVTRTLSLSHSCLRRHTNTGWCARLVFAMRPWSNSLSSKACHMPYPAYCLVCSCRGSCRFRCRTPSHTYAYHTSLRVPYCDFLTCRCYCLCVLFSLSHPLLGDLIVLSVLVLLNVRNSTRAFRWISHIITRPLSCVSSLASSCRWCQISFRSSALCRVLCAIRWTCTTNQRPRCLCRRFA